MTVYGSVQEQIFFLNFVISSYPINLVRLLFCFLLFFASFCSAVEVGRLTVFYVLLRNSISFTRGLYQSYFGVA